MMSLQSGSNSRLRYAVAAVLFLCMITGVAGQVAHARRLVVVFGLDETGSYNLRQGALRMAGSVIAQLDSGDVLYVRRITHQSYSDDCIVFRLEIPAVGEEPDNRFDTRARRVWKSRQKAVAEIKKKAVCQLSNLKSIDPPRTDIWGFLASAAERIRYENPADCQPVVVIGSDMIDNCRKKTQLDLNGARVLIAGFESGEDADKARDVRTRWIQELTHCNASEITFLPPDCGFSLR